MLASKSPRSQLPAVRRSPIAFLGAVGVLAALCIAALTAQSGSRNMPLDPAREKGASITPAYEGWFPNPDGTFSLLIGYFNRNTRESIDIPIGPGNRIEPGDLDQGQPTHFEPGREWGVFVIKVPKDFGTRSITWTVAANGVTQSVPFTLNPAYVITPYKESGMGNQPPVITFASGGPTFTGPPLGIAATLTATVNQPVPLTVWVQDPKGAGWAGPVSRLGLPQHEVASVSFHKFRGAGRVTFDKAGIPVHRQDEMVAASATFDSPGDYVVRVQANDESEDGGRGFQCCWTNALVRVVVK